MYFEYTTCNYSSSYMFRAPVGLQQAIAFLSSKAAHFRYTFTYACITTASYCAVTM